MIIFFFTVSTPYCHPGQSAIMSAIAALFLAPRWKPRPLTLVFDRLFYIQEPLQTRF